MEGSCPRMILKEIPMNIRTKSSALKFLALSAGIAASMTLGGCSNAGEGLFTGAALGATTGLIIGSMNGEAGEGAALGAVLGAVGGSIIGDQNERKEQNARHHNRSHSGYGHDDPWWESDDWDD